MEKKIELLAPGGDVNSIKAAIIAGADAVYCGLDRFNARNRAANISFDELQGVMRLAHNYRCEVFLTLNILILENEIPALIQLLNQLVNTNIDGIIVQDLGLLYILSTYYKSLRIHASTQMTTHNEGQIKFLARLHAERVNLSRELNLKEIKHLTSVGKKHEVQTEVFVHGSQCISFSGICYMSSVHGGNSGNRGRCSQPCRDRYLTTPAGKEYPLNLKDNSAYSNIGELYEAGVYSLKIEGRIKKHDYIYTVVGSYKKQIENWQKHQTLLSEKNMLYKVFNRDFSNAYLTAEISKDMFIDNPRDYSVIRLKKDKAFQSLTEREQAEKDLFEEKDRIMEDVETKTKKLSIEKLPVILRITGEVASPLKISVQTPDASFDVISEVVLSNKGTESISYSTLFKRLKAINTSNYYISEMNLEGINDRLYLPFKELTVLRNRILFLLMDSKKNITPVQLPQIKSQPKQGIKPALSVFISSLNDLHHTSETDTSIYFKLPGNFKNRFSEYIEVFRKERNLIPCFPSVLIGDEYSTAVDFIHKVRPNSLVTDNTGIAFEAYQLGLEWIAGPGLNIVNSYSLKCLKKQFNCAGAFISSELSRMQLRGIQKPDNFNLYFSVYHPHVLMTSRQCFTQQTMGCNKKVVDSECIENCEKSSSITNTKGISFAVVKSKGNYHQIYSNQNYLNTDIISDNLKMFDSFFIDLSDVATETMVTISKAEIIRHFNDLVSGNSKASQLIRQSVYPTSCIQYKKGI
ncbi:peptidase U32 family protein [Saccharicrinis sp. GN24d3]|uniref:peptidase U32 family protein n=1 Tax=Saccharicrinis sp. GN24d3 TaxID=3458416 RepID=UPI004036F1A7